MLKPSAKWPKLLLLLSLPQFWPSSIIYAYYTVYLLLNSIFKFKGKIYPLVLNKAISNNGGLANVPKSSIAQLFNSQLFANTIVVTPDQFAQATQLIAQAQIAFPLVAKPNNAYRGIDVLLIQDQTQLNTYLSQANYNVLLEEFITLPQEVAVFINKIDDEPCKIIGITGKQFLTVEGTGNHTIKELLNQNFRYKLCRKQIDPHWVNHWHSIPAKGQKIIIQPIGNFNKGTTFLDITEQCTPAMEQFFTSILPSKGVNHGRFDIKIQDISSLETGKGFKIIEFNGLLAEPVNYHHPSYSFFQAQKIIMRHARQQLITAKAQLALGHSCPNFWQGLRIYRQSFAFKNANKAVQY